MNHDDFIQDFISKRNEYQNKIIEGESEINSLNEQISKIYYKRAVRRHDIENYKKILKTINEQLEKYGLYTSENIIKIVNEFTGSSDEDYINLVKKVFPNSENITYLTRCVRYLGINEKIHGIDTVGYGKKWYELPEEDIVKAAHITYNCYLVQKTSPHKFTHYHSDGIKECNWYAPFSYCDCNKKCVYWDTKKVNWFLDINLNSDKPVGKAKCRHVN
ncbi:hypothetical protein H012_gp528 [Acanthamoeba polyphaga moumouvirus]|uniref:Uncharacterized protein n=2 Tax=Moumouvirus TaxID=3080801 RepID=L7RCB6_9VIRU|nr:hypothetical protein H012_gp528 [Acanthamoeba polyphaga moumouvirus]AEX62819.1 hypothetical protein mv_L614 [Moumouvirus Monve]AGC01932.1 hypothetical protein Moumou_00396 [Acanthamoeba polyphaga moumouvirus]